MSSFGNTNNFAGMMSKATNQGRYAAPSGYQGSVNSGSGATISPYTNRAPGYGFFGGGYGNQLGYGNPSSVLSSFQPSIQFSPGMNVATGGSTPGIRFGPNTTVATAAIRFKLSAT
jgi:hypothetical protein